MRVSSIFSEVLLSFLEENKMKSQHWYNSVNKEIHWHLNIKNLKICRSIHHILKLCSVWLDTNHANYHHHEMFAQEFQITFRLRILLWLIDKHVDFRILGTQFRVRIQKSYRDLCVLAKVKAAVVKKWIETKSKQIPQKLHILIQGFVASGFKPRFTRKTQRRS